jgi:hypothetical protein
VQPGDTIAQPATGFHVASVHSMSERPAISSPL